MPRRTAQAQGRKWGYRLTPTAGDRDHSGHPQGQGLPASEGPQDPITRTQARQNPVIAPKPAPPGPMKPTGPPVSRLEGLPTLPPSGTST
jgi:hypothetical protein